jgi:hypothetical protein
LNQSSVDLASFTRYQTSFAVGQASAPLRIRTAVADLNVVPTDGSSPTPGITNVDLGSAEASTISVYGGSNTGSSGRASTAVKANHTDSVLHIYAGTVDVCNNNPADTGEFETITLRGRNAKATLGSGLATLNTLTLRDGASATVRCAVASLDNGERCSVKTEGAGAVTTFATDGPTIINSTGTITNLHAETNADVDTTQTSKARTVTNAFAYGAAKIKTDINTTYTNGIDCLRGAKTTQIDAGDNVTVGITAT